MCNCSAPSCGGRGGGRGGGGDWWRGGLGEMVESLQGATKWWGWLACAMMMMMGMGFGERDLNFSCS